MHIKFVVYLTCTTNNFQSFNKYRKGNHWHQQLLSQGSNRISSFGFWLSWTHWRNHVENLVDFTDQHPSKQWWLGRYRPKHGWCIYLFNMYVFFNLGLVTARQKSALCCLVGLHASANVGPVVLCWYFGTLQLLRGWIMGHSGMWVSFCYRLPRFTHQNMPRLMIANEYAATWFSPLLHHTLPLRTGLIGGEVSRLGA